MLAIWLIFSRPQPEELDASADDGGGQDFLVPGVIQEEREKNSKVASTAISTRIVKYYTKVSCFPRLFTNYSLPVLYLGTPTTCEIARRRFNVQIIAVVLLRCTTARAFTVF